MSLVKVWNDNEYPYKESFKGMDINIAAHEYMEMEEDDANLFRGTMCTIIRTADGLFDPRCYKMIRIEKIIPKIKEEKEEKKGVPISKEQEKAFTK